MDIVQHKARLRQYFDGIGFERWSAIYGHAELSAIRRSIREGHNAMLQLAESWIAASGPHSGTALDAGCGTGLFSVALARRGLSVTAADLAPQMTEAAAAAATRAGVAHAVSCQVSDLEDLSGSYALVACFDVLIHYPPELFAPMLRHLAGLSTDTLLFTYAPSTPLLAALHRAAALFPKNQRRTDIQMIPEPLVRSTLASCGLRLTRSQRVSKGFYHVTLVEAKR